MRTDQHRDVQRPLVAAFDVDGTLTRRDCVVPFLRTVGGTSGVVAGLLRRAHRVIPAAMRRDRDGLKEIATAAVFSGRRADEVDAIGERFAERVRTSWLRADTSRTLGDHLRDGHHVVLVSASYGAYLRPLATALGVGDVVCTELAIEADGRCNGQLDGGNCRGAVKVIRLHRWLDANYGGRANVELWAYGDSAGDRPMLDDADRAVWVNGTR